MSDTTSLSQEKRWQLLTAVTTQRTPDHNAQIRFALQETLKFLALDIAIVSQIVDDEYTVVHFSAPDEAPLHTGQKFNLGETYCAITLQADDVVAIDHMKESEHHRHPCYETFQLEAYIGAPIFIDGNRFGTLNFSSSTPHTAAFSNEDRDMVRLLAQWVGSLLDRDIQEKTSQRNIRFREAVLENSDYAILATNADGYFQVFNQAAEEMLGYTAAELIDKEHALVLYDEQEVTARATELSKAIGRPISKQAAIAGQALYFPEDNHEETWTYIRKDGRPLRASVTLTLIKNDNDEVDGFLATAKDVTLQEKVASDLNLRTQAIEESINPIILADALGADMPIIYANKAFERVTGHSREEVLGKSWYFLRGNDIDQPEFKTVSHAIEEREPCIVELRNYRKNGEMFWNRVQLSPVRDPNGQVTHFAIIQSDITQQKIDQESLTKQAQQLKTVSDVSSIITTMQEQSAMIQSVVDLTKERFNLYHAHVFLLNTDTNTLVLTAGAGDVGRQMVAEGREIPLNAEESLVATAARTRQVQIRDYEGEMEGFSPHPALIDTRSEMAIPLVVGPTVIGVLDVRSEYEQAFDDTDVQTKSTLASQVAIAIQNTQQYEQTQNMLGSMAIQAQSMGDLAELGVALNGTNNEKETFQALAEYAIDIVGAERMSIAWLLESGKQLELLTVSGEKGLIPTGHTLPVEGTAVGHSIQSEALNLSYNYSDSTDLDLAQLSKSGILSTINAPLFIGGELSGTLNFGFTTSHEPSITAQQLAQQLASMLGQNLAKNRVLQESTKQVTQLKTVSDVAANISAVQDANELLKQVTDLTKERFDLYHSHIYLLNDIGDTLLLTAGAGMVGDQMVAERRQISMDALQSLVARSARSHEAIIVNNVHSDDGFLPHPLLPQTVSEMAVPIISRNQLFGVLDIQASQADFFGELDAEVFLALAAQIAVALQNAQTFRLSEETLQDLNTLTRRLTNEGWENYLERARDEKTAFAYDSVDVKPLDEIPESLEITTLIEKSIVLRGAKIGDIALADPQEFSAEVEDIIAAVTESLGNHIENLRLTEQTQDALANTQVLYNASDEIGRATTVQGILHTLVQVTALKDLHRSSIAFFPYPWYEDDAPPKAEVIASWSTSGQSLENLVFPIDDVSFFYNFNPDRHTIIQDLAQNETFTKFERETLSDVGAKSLIAFPINLQNQWNGVLFSESLTDDIQISAEDIQRISNLTNQAATAIDNRRLFKQTQSALASSEEQVRRLALLSELSYNLNAADELEDALQLTVNNIPSILHAARASITFVDLDADTMTIMAVSGENYGLGTGSPVTLGDSPIKESVTKRQIVAYAGRVNEQGDTAQPIMHAPLISQRHVVGTINVTNPYEDYDDRDENILSQVANVLSAVIESKQLLADTQERATTLETLSQIEAGLSQATSNRDVIEVLANNLTPARVSHIVLQQMDINARTGAVAYRNEIGWQDGQVWSDDHPALQNPLQITDWPMVWRHVQSGSTAPLIGAIKKEENPAEHDVAGQLLLPLRAGGMWQGLVLVSWHEDPEFSDNDRFLFERLIEPLSAIVSSQRASEAQLKAQQETRLLYEASRQINESNNELDNLIPILRNISPTAAFNRITVYLLDQDAKQGVKALQVVNSWHNGDGEQPAQVGTRYPRQKFAEIAYLFSLDPLFIEDINSPDEHSIRQENKEGFINRKTESLAILPLIVGTQQIGAILLESGTEHHFNDGERNMYSSLAPQIAVTMQNQILFNEAEARARREQILREVTERVRNASDVNSVLKTAVAEVGRVLGRKAFVYLKDSQQ